MKGTKQKRVINDGLARLNRVRRLKKQLIDTAVRAKRKALLSVVENEIASFKRSIEEKSDALFGAILDNGTAERS